jgi:hypothetical protein
LQQQQQFFHRRNFAGISYARAVSSLNNNFSWLLCPLVTLAARRVCLPLAPTGFSSSDIDCSEIKQILMFASNFVIRMIRQFDGNCSNILETHETNDFFWTSSTGKPTDTKGASDNEAFVEKQTQFFIV